MTKILMIQMQIAPYTGTAYLNSAARSAGHTFLLAVESNKDKIFARIKHDEPDIIGFSCMSCFWEEILDMTKKIKKKFPNIPIIIGGPHPTFCPDIINEKSIDIICRGEGEYALVDLLNAMREKQEYTTVLNLWVKNKDGIHRNNLRPLADPLDKLPLIDWSCYKGTAVKNSSPIVFPIRGCPYACSYCFNAETRALYRDLGKYVRHFSVERTMAEIREALDFFSDGPILFTSDSFGIDLDWMDELFTQYDKTITRPYVLLLRPELTNDRCISILAKHKCYGVALGVESGSERVRKVALNRHYPNKMLLQIAEKLHKHKIKFRTYNMIGLPTETEDEVWETIDINIQMKTDFPRTSIFTPFPGTKIVELCKREKYLPVDFTFKHLPKTVLAETILKKIDKDRVKNQLYFFQTVIIFPWTKPLVKRLIKMRPNILFRLWFYFIYAYLHRKSEQRKLLPYIKYLVSNSKYK